MVRAYSQTKSPKIKSNQNKQLWSKWTILTSADSCDRNPCKLASYDSDLGGGSSGWNHSYNKIIPRIVTMKSINKRF